MLALLIELKIDCDPFLFKPNQTFNLSLSYSEKTQEDGTVKKNSLCRFLHGYGHLIQFRLAKWFIGKKKVIKEF